MATALVKKAACAERSAGAYMLATLRVWPPQRTRRETSRPSAERQSLSTERLPPCSRSALMRTAMAAPPEWWGLVSAGAVRGPDVEG